MEGGIQFWRSATPHQIYSFFIWIAFFSLATYAIIKISRRARERRWNAAFESAVYELQPTVHERDLILEIMSSREPEDALRALERQEVFDEIVERYLRQIVKKAGDIRNKRDIIGAVYNLRVKVLEHRYGHALKPGAVEESEPVRRVEGRKEGNGE